MNLSNYLADPAEKPLERIVDDGGFTSIFRTIACIGDSLASGEFESTDEAKTKKGYHDYFEYSWGQYIARAAGSTVYNFSRGGMTAKEYWERFAESKDFWNPDLAAQCYIMALGVNDLLNQTQEVGSAADVDLSDYNNNKPTFAGYFAKIIQRYKSMQPQARFFLITIPQSNGSEKRSERVDAHRQLMYDLAKLFDYTYVIDLNEYGPVYDAEFDKSFFLGGHMNPMGYILTAKMVMSYIDYIVRHNMEDFSQVGFIGKGVHNYNAKW